MKKEVMYPKLKAKMAYNGDNIETLADVLKLSKVAVSNRLNGLTQFKTNEVYELCVRYHCTYNDLLRLPNEQQ